MAVTSESINYCDLSAYDYELPASLIARYPTKERSQSRLLVLDKNSGEIVDTQFNQIINYLSPGDLLIFNDSKVIPARLFGHKASGGKVEVLIEKILNPSQAICYIRASRSPKVGSHIHITDSLSLTVIDREDELFTLQFPKEKSILAYLQTHGHIPLPPYFNRDATALDKKRYQTVYAKHEGSVAAPTAGLHFDEKILSMLEARGVQLGYLTLHVGSGTFAPVRCQDIRQHHMHTEWFTLSEKLRDQILQTKARNKHVICVGTTATRALEAASESGQIKAYEGETDIFIYPGYPFKIVDGMITNFHLPESTLLMLVSALAGFEPIKHAYAHAIREQYRFYSYGDAMFIKPEQRG